MNSKGQQYNEWTEDEITFTQKVTATTAEGCEMVMHHTTTVTEVSPSGSRNILATGIGNTDDESERNARNELRAVIMYEC